MYADKITDSMQRAIDETNRRRKIQQEYNIEHHITPKGLNKSKEAIMEQTSVADSKKDAKQYYVEPEAKATVAADPVIAYMAEDQLEKLIADTQKKMEKAAKELNFMEAAQLRDELFELKKLLENKQEA